MPNARPEAGSDTDGNAAAPRRSSARESQPPAKQPASATVISRTHRPNGLGSVRDQSEATHSLGRCGRALIADRGTVLTERLAASADVAHACRRRPVHNTAAATGSTRPPAAGESGREHRLYAHVGRRALSMSTPSSCRCQGYGRLRARCEFGHRRARRPASPQGHRPSAGRAASSAPR
jgi:hypothetical protein